MHIEESKIKMIVSYLQEKFPDAQINNKYNFDLGVQAFRIQLGKKLYLLQATENFLADNSAQEILKHLECQKIADLIIDSNGRSLLIKSDQPA